MADPTPIKTRLTDDMKSAMRSGDKATLGTIRLALAAIKQIEVDTRKDLDDAAVLTVLDKMVKQRRESIQHFEQAGRNELAAKEHQEIKTLQTYLPEQLSMQEIATLIEEALANTGASSIRDMGKVMGQLKPKLQGRADMSVVSQQIKERLA
jgi:uncharacterized protein YqeY